MRTILVIGAGRLQIPAYQAARAMGIRSIAVDRDPAAPGMALADAAHPVDTSDTDGILRIARAERVGGVVTLCTDHPVRAVAAVAAELGLCALTPAAALAATDKAAMRAAFREAGAPSPGSILVRTVEEAREALATVGLPAIGKPTRSAGSRGIMKIDRPDQIEAAFQHALSASPNGDVLIEEFVEGPEVSVESLSFGGRHRIIAITDKRTTGSPHWVETGHAEPCRLPSADQEAIRGATAAGLDALGIDNAAGHTEIKLGARGPRIMEIGARLGGDFITTELVRRSTGVNMAEAVIRIALGEAPDVVATRHTGAAIRYLVASPGTVVAVDGVEEARRLPGVVRLEVDVRAGENVRPLRSSLDRPGFVICEGGDAEEADRRAESAARVIRIRTTGGRLS